MLACASLAPLGCGELDVSGASEPPRDGGGDPGPDSNSPTCELTCAPDGRSILDGCHDDAVWEACPADQACAPFNGGARCVPPCQAAEVVNGSAGCSFHAIPPDAHEDVAGSCFVMALTNTSPRPASIAAEWGGEKLDISKSVYTVKRTDGTAAYTRLDPQIWPGEVALVFLAAAKDGSGSSFTSCPPDVTPALEIDPLVHGTGWEKAFHVKTDFPVAAYTVFPYGKDPSSIVATLLFPSTAKTTDYILSMPTATGLADRRSTTMQLVAFEDETEVVIKPSFDIAGGGGLPSTPAGTIVHSMIDRGRSLQITQDSAMAGSLVLANRPIALFAGAQCSTSSGSATCDAAHVQLAPFIRWGHEYALVAPDARERARYTLIGARDGTILTWSPSKPDGAPDTLSTNQVVSLVAGSALTVKSQDDEHPFHAALDTNESGIGGNGTPVLGGRYVELVATDQYLARSDFYVDDSLPDTSLTIVRKRTDSGFKSVFLECAGEISGWRPVADKGEFEVAQVTVTKAFEAQPSPKGSCGYGRHAAASEGPFTVTVSGRGAHATYGYSAGVGGKPAKRVAPTGGP